MSTSSATTEPDRRARLLDRYAALNHEAQARFKALGVDRNDIDAIERALDEVDAFTVVAPLAEPKAPEPADEPRQPVSAADLDHLVGMVKASNVRHVINNWLTEGKQAGNPWNVMASPYVDNWERTRAALHLAVQCSDEAGIKVDTECARELLRAAVGDPAAEWPSLPIGAIVGQLTIAQARHAYNLADAFGTVVLPRYTDDDVLYLIGVEAVAA